MAVTPTNDGILNIPLGGVAAFAVATIKPAGPLTNAAPAPEDIVPALNITVCVTDHTGACRSAIGNPTIGAVGGGGAGVTATFSVFVKATSPVSFDPENNRITLYLAGYKHHHRAL
jgi:hypothetical protein